MGCDGSTWCLCSAEICSCTVMEAWAQVRSLHDHKHHLREEPRAKLVHNTVAHGHSEACTEQRATFRAAVSKSTSCPSSGPGSWKLAAVTHATLQASIHLWKGSEVSNVCWSVTWSRVTRELTTDAINRNLQLSTAGNRTNGGQTSQGQFGDRRRRGWLQQLYTNLLI